MDQRAAVIAAQGGCVRVEPAAAVVDAGQELPDGAGERIRARVQPERIREPHARPGRIRHLVLAGF